MCPADWLGLLVHHSQPISCSVPLEEQPPVRGQYDSDLLSQSDTIFYWGELNIQPKVLSTQQRGCVMFDPSLVNYFMQSSKVTSEHKKTPLPLQKTLFLSQLLKQTVQLIHAGRSEQTKYTLSKHVNTWLVRFTSHPSFPSCVPDTREIVHGWSLLKCPAYNKNV